MSAYPGPGLANLLRVNRQAYLWQAEAPPAGIYPGSLSLAYQLERLDNAFYPWGAAFELWFSGNPGVFEVDILGAQIDQPQNYAQIGAITLASSYVPGFYVGRWDMPSNLWVKYVAAYMKTLTNAVNATLLVTR
jgi:hypothetical protein